MKPSLIKAAVSACLQAQQTAFIWGPPGVGKSEVMRQACDEAGYALKDVRAILLDPVDLRGIPCADGNRTKWLVPDFLPQAERDGEKGALFLDELNAAPPSTQAACYQLTLDRAIGDYRLPDGWSVIAAGNRETDRAVTNRMPSALANRFVHLNYDVDLEDWRTWAITNDVQTEVLAFIGFRPNLLHNFDPQQKAFPSPRSWAFVSKLLKAGMPKECELDLLQGTIGEGASAEFYAFMKIWRGLPNPDAVLMDPKGAAVPKDPATLYALSAAIAARASAQNFERLTIYSGRMPQEFNVLTVRDAIKREPAVQATRAFIDWAKNNKSVLI